MSQRDQIVRLYSMMSVLLYKWGPVHCGTHSNIDSVDKLVRYVFADMPDVRAYGSFGEYYSPRLRYEIRPGEFWIGRLCSNEDEECFGSNVLVTKPEITQVEFTEFIKKFGRMFDWSISHGPYHRVFDEDFDYDDVGGCTDACCLAVPPRPPVPQPRTVSRPDMSRVRFLDEPDIPDADGDHRIGTWNKRTPPEWLPFVYVGQLYVSDVPLDDEGRRGYAPFDFCMTLATTSTPVELPAALAKYMCDHEAYIVGEYALACVDPSIRATRIDVIVSAVYESRISTIGTVESIRSDPDCVEFAFLPQCRPIQVMQCTVPECSLPVYFTFFRANFGTDCDPEITPHKMPYTVLSTMIIRNGYLRVFDVHRQDHIDRILRPGLRAEPARPAITEMFTKLGFTLA